MILHDSFNFVFISNIGTLLRVSIGKVTLPRKLLKASLVTSNVKHLYFLILNAWHCYV